MPTLITEGAASAKGFGQTNAPAPVYVEDVFSTYLYTGNGSTQTITNGVDLAGKGGLVWTKSRSLASDNGLTDTARGAGAAGNGTSNILVTNAALSEGTASGGATPRNNLDYVSAFNSNGFSVGAGGGTDVAKQMTNTNAATYVSWTFRKQPKFFDIVTYTGDGTTNKVINHNLGSTPGLIITKRTDAGGNGTVWHRSFVDTKTYAYLNLTDAAVTASGATAMTVDATSFTIGTNQIFGNGNGWTYVAYLFAHDAGGFGASGTDNAISCGSVTADGSGNISVNLGYEPQWLMLKRTNSTSGWYIFDAMRGMPDYSANANNIYADSSAAEAGGFQIAPTSTGFKWAAIASATYIYIAIRRGPMKTPTDATKVFNTQTATVNAEGNTLNEITTSFPVDLGVAKSRSDSAGGSNLGPTWLTRLSGGLLYSGGGNGTNAEATTTPNSSALNSSSRFASNTKVTLVPSTTLGNQSHGTWSFVRAPGFFDVVCYTGTGANRTVNHNLGVVPEFIFIKKRSAAGNNWNCYNATLSNAGIIYLNDVAAAQTTGRTEWNTTTPTSTVFSLGTPDAVNGSAATYVAYLFASCPGVSKVGSYTGNGTSQTINCGFTAGARFVLIKRTDSTGDWYVWDTARGIVAANDPHLSLNTIAAEVTTDDSIDPDNSGFIVNQLAATNINVNTATYIFLAIA